MKTRIEVLKILTATSEPDDVSAVYTLASLPVDTQPYILLREGGAASEWG